MFLNKYLIISKHFDKVVYYKILFPCLTLLYYSILPVANTSKIQYNLLLTFLNKLIFNNYQLFVTRMKVQRSQTFKAGEDKAKSIIAKPRIPR